MEQDGAAAYGVTLPDRRCFYSAGYRQVCLSRYNTHNLLISYTCKLHVYKWVNFVPSPFHVVCLNSCWLQDSTRVSSLTEAVRSSIIYFIKLFFKSNLYKIRKSQHLKYIVNQSYKISQLCVDFATLSGTWDTRKTYFENYRLHHILIVYNNGKYI